MTILDSIKAAEDKERASYSSVLLRNATDYYIRSNATQSKFVIIRNTYMNAIDQCEAVTQLNATYNLIEATYTARKFGSARSPSPYYGPN